MISLVCYLFHGFLGIFYYSIKGVSGIKFKFIGANEKINLSQKLALPLKKVMYWIDFGRKKEEEILYLLSSYSLFLFLPTLYFFNVIFYIFKEDILISLYSCHLESVNINISHFHLKKFTMLKKMAFKMEAEVIPLTISSPILSPNP